MNVIPSAGDKWQYKIRWLLEELGAEYQIRKLDSQAHENEKPDYLEIHPLGMVPVIEDDGKIIFESGAICLYLTEKYENRGMAPQSSSPWRGDFLAWIFMSTVTLDPMLIRVFDAKKLPPKEGDQLIQEIKDAFTPVAKKLESILAKQNYLVGGEFSAADIMMAQPLNWANHAQLLNQYPSLIQYLNRLRDRPACKRSQIFG